MQYDTDTRRTEHAMAEIGSLDLEPVKLKISCKEQGYGWTSEHVDRIEHAYRRYLVLLAKFPQLEIAPTRDIDAFWHAHILHTRKYAADCERVFGGFLHHRPDLGPRGERDSSDQDANTLCQLFVSEFGEAVPNNARGPGADTPSAAWCGAEAPTSRATAWCGAEVTTKPATAWCGAEVTTKPATAWCGAEAPTKPATAWCGAEVATKPATAWCGAEAPTKPATAWCGAEVTLGATQPASRTRPAALQGTGRADRAH